MVERIRRFFFPPGERSKVRRYGPVLFVFAVPVFLLLAIPPAWEYSNTADFCGKTCHTMPPEYNTYLVSPHARVPCVDCHIGRDWIAKQALRKTEHVTLLYKTVTGDYEYPIRVSSMRPARDTCERCHFPEKFSDDSLRVIHRFDDSEENAPYAIYLLMHTGGGSQREGLGRGIHWHIENKIEYITTDAEHQDIPWVRVQYADGTTDEYVSLDATIDTDNLGQYTLHEMDCISCHNRISHLIPPPRTLVDTALLRGDLPADLPYIRARAVEALALTDDAAFEQALAEMETFYQEEYPDLYEERRADVDSAIALVAQLHADNTYSEQELNWETHPNNIGHRDSAGCFRCHDGKHFNAAGEAVRLECNLCHSIPQIVRPGVIEPMLPLVTGLEPSSHLDSTWIARHHVELDETCTNCHTTENAGGTTDTSFCSNSGCHGVDWRYAGFDAPSLAAALGLDQGPEAPPVAAPPLAEGEAITYQQLQPVLEQACGQCHGAAPIKGLRVTDYESLLAGSESGPVIVPGSPDESLILSVLKGGHFAKLSDEQMALLEQWIAAGAPPGEAPPEEAAGQAVTYADIGPALTEQCGTCQGAAKTKGLQVTDYESLLAGSDSGPVIVPGSPDESLILSVLKGGHFAKLSDEQMALLEQWIAAGAPPGEAAAPAEEPVSPTATPEDDEG